MPALDLSAAKWRKSSRSSDVANCVEVAVVSQAIVVRDSKHRTGGTVVVSQPAWSAFTSALRADELS